MSQGKAAARWKGMNFTLAAPCVLTHLFLQNDYPPNIHATGHRFTPVSPKPIRMSDPNLSSFIWSVADLLRGDYKQSEYGKVILPFTVLRRLDCVLEETKSAVRAELAKRTAAKVNPEPFLLRKAGQLFYNTSPLDLKKLMGDQDHIGENLRAYLQAFSPAVRGILKVSSFTPKLTASRKPACFTSSRKSSPTLIFTPPPSATTRWARCSRSSSANSPSFPMKPPGNISPRATPSGSW
jgi:hypothetical protein